ncbi:Aliphatic sulfonates import ATP-binding protein SsuB [Propionispora sp. 2/2-37]|uniref:ABC transporter ATP-binding protein n=1 Tax=Propionispora sp. 2/2-37 TaxID=1677858 RepID=UPI0006BB5D7D|nr:ATP-binding cassette domain-containing protein [Propionispora sp. 2/2-37]CUH95101.1 Aliphatic sulfonates import ATP-binding protein SsuB [Propionispora sp. 2/2-37]
MSDTIKGFAIEIQNVSKCFGTVQVLKNLNLSIAPGEFVALVGQSGCGKSTLLRLISHLEVPTTGSIVLHDAPVRQINPEVRYLFQEARLLPWKKVWENVALGSKERSRERAIGALEEVDLANKAEEWPAVLSGGQKQRVSLARALAGEPKLLLLDEPLGALDALTRINMQVLIEKLWKEQGFTVVLVTHDVGEAVYLADRVVLIEEGRIALDKKVTLARPRVKDSSFAYFERLILARVLKQEQKGAQEISDEIYAI